MVKIGTQVRSISDPKVYGQVVVFHAPPKNEAEEQEEAARLAEFGPRHDIQIQTTGGNLLGFSHGELRRERFMEFLFKRPGSFGKHEAPLAVLIHIGSILVATGMFLETSALSGVLTLAGMLSGYYLLHYLNFRWILK